jgi:anti-anti-sigma factor
MIHEVEKVGDEIIIIRLKGELDHHSTNDIRNEIVPMIKNGSIKVIVWNLKDLNFMDSSGDRVNFRQNERACSDRWTNNYCKSVTNNA